MRFFGRGATACPDAALSCRVASRGAALGLAAALGLTAALGLAAVLSGACAAAEESGRADGGDGPSAVSDGSGDNEAGDAAPEASVADARGKDAPAADGAADSRPADDAVVGDGGNDGECTGTGTTPDNCGPCGVVCPGHGQSTAVVGCTSPDCTFACQGENYDCNADPADGCEVADTYPGTHTQATALYLGPFSCWDDESAQNIIGLLPTDARVHQDPAIDGLDAAIGGAPDWYRIDAEGGTFCEDDISLTLQVSGSASPACYQLQAISDVATYACQTSASGSCGIFPGMSSYGDGTVIYLVVEKTCAGVVSEEVSYTVTGHL